MSSKIIEFPVNFIDENNINYEDDGFVNIFRCSGIEIFDESQYDDPQFFTLDIVDVSENHSHMHMLKNKKVKITFEILDD